MIAPNDRIAWHNYASVLGDLNRNDEAKAAAERAIRMGLEAPETRLVYGRALLGLGKLDEAEAAYRDALFRRPAYGEAHRDLAQLIWMRTADVDAALKPLDRADPQGANAELASVRALVLDRGGRPREAYEVLNAAIARHPGDPRLRLSAAQAAADLGEDAAAVRLAESVAQVAPGVPAVEEALCTVYLAAGRPHDALAVARRRLARAPHDHVALAFAAVAARMVGDPQYERLYDYAAFVRPAQIAAPKGWRSLDAYLADLKDALVRLHALKAHPLENSLRGGSQTSQSLLRSKDPVITAFFQAIDEPIRAYMAAVGNGDDPVRSRNTGDYSVKAAWSVRLRPNGFHVDHIHPQGWLSSAFYVETPAAALDTPGREGWIRFGRPRMRTTPALDAGHYVRPEPGTLVLFPSYMWHGTVPFTTDESRMTVAFDVVPA
nr:putative 2OG-Fe(II) oxygenase [Caulobacter sp. 17J80-11]